MPFYLLISLICKISLTFSSVFFCVVIVREIVYLFFQQNLNLLLLIEEFVIPFLL